MENFKQNDKDQLEIEKLKAEIKKLNVPFWKDPKIIGTILAFLISFSFNIIQFNQEIKNQDKIQQLEKEKLDLQKMSVSNEIENSSKKKKQINKINEELEKINKDIEIWDGAIFKDENELTLMKQTLKQYKEQKRTVMIDAQNENIQSQENTIAKKKEELDTLKKRKSELEQERNTLHTK